MKRPDEHVSILVVVDNPKKWPLDLPGVTLLSSREYLSDPAIAALSGAKVFNLCRSLKYQTAGYYVSLLAAARGHKPLPSIATIQDLRLTPVIRVAGHDLGDLIQKTLRPLRSERFDLSVYFGRNISARYDRLSLALFNQFPAPFLRATFRREGDAWSLDGLRAIGANEIPEEHRPFLHQQAARYFERPHRRVRAKALPKYDLAILRCEEEATPPSDAKAMHKFVDAAESLGFRVELIGKDSYGRVAEFDALFIRETTSVNHHTFRFARRAAAEGMIVMDDSDSILRCTNKVYLAELLARKRIATPRTVIISRDTIDLAPDRIGFPCVIKQPDGSFSSGVVKVNGPEEYEKTTTRLFEQSELLLAQEFVPTEFDWRIGVLGGEPLYACRYYMARKHWQIIKREGNRIVDGRADAHPVEEVPDNVISAAVRSARLMGDGLYGVDIKVLGGRPLVIEVNDNPSIDADVEDRVLGNALYERIMRCFFDRLEARRNRSGSA